MKLISLVFSCILISFFGTCQQDENIGPGVFEGEPYLVVNPSNSQNIVVAWMHITTGMRSIRTRATFDGGQTWSPDNDIQHMFQNYADPTMAFDNSGTLYLVFINHTSGTTNSGGVFSIKSNDGGLSWTGIQEVVNINDDAPHQPVDRPWLVCDRSNGSHDGNLYVTTKVVNGTPAPYRPYFIRSTDGAQSWEPWQYLDTTNWLSGTPSAMAVPSVDANGSFHGIYISYVPTQSPLPKYFMVSSDDGGSSFTYNEVISFVPGAMSNDSAKMAWQMIADPSDADHLVLFFVQGESGDLDILMTETVDGGANWSSLIRVNDDPVGNGTLQDLVWASFDTDGDMVVCWRDRRNDPGPGYARETETYGAVRWKDSLSFSPNFVISDIPVPFNNILAEAGNDFLSQQIVNDTLYVAWGDTRTGFLNIWFDKIALSSGSTNGLINLAHSEMSSIEIYPNPSSDWIKVETGEEEFERIEIYDIKGELKFVQTVNEFSVKNFPSGIYYIVVDSDSGRKVNRFIKK